MIDLPPISPVYAPIAAKYAVWIKDVPEDYVAITTEIPIAWRIDGEPAIERFARDQIGRQFVVAFDNSHRSQFHNTAEIFVHKQHITSFRKIEREAMKAFSHTYRRPTYETNGKSLGKAKENSAPKKNGRWNWMDR